MWNNALQPKQIPTGIVGTMNINIDTKTASYSRKWKNIFAVSTDTFPASRTNPEPLVIIVPIETVSYLYNITGYEFFNAKIPFYHSFYSLAGVRRYDVLL